MNDRTRTIIIAVVTTVWGVNFGAGLFIKDYTPDQAINGIFMAVVGGLFALGNRASNGNGNGSPNSTNKQDVSGGGGNGG